MCEAVYVNMCMCVFECDVCVMNTSVCMIQCNKLITGQDNDDDSCDSGDIRLRNVSRIRFLYGSESLTGRVEACLNGIYVDVCGDTQYAQYFGDNSCRYLRFSK